MPIDRTPALRLTLVLAGFLFTACGQGSTTSSPGEDAGPGGEGGGSHPTNEAGSLTDSGPAADTGRSPGPFDDGGSPSDAGTGSDSVVQGGCTAVLSDAGAVGEPCQTSAACSNALCLDVAPFACGYCSFPIAECPASAGGPGPCPTGSACVNGRAPIDGTDGDYCMAICTGDGQCRTSEGYKCCSGLALSGDSVCAPASFCP